MSAIIIINKLLSDILKKKITCALAIAKNAAITPKTTIPNIIQEIQLTTLHWSAEYHTIRRWLREEALWSSARQVTRSQGIFEREGREMLHLCNLTQMQTLPFFFKYSCICSWSNHQFKKKIEQYDTIWKMFHLKNVKVEMLE